MKSFVDEATNFSKKEMPKEGSYYTFIAVVTIYCLLKRDENYYLIHNYF